MKLPSTHLRLSPTSQSHLLSPEQTRFNKLTQQIEQARLKLAAWHDNLPPFLSALEERTVSMAQAIQETQTNWIRELDRLLGEKGWSKRERATLRDLLCEAAYHLIDSHDEPPAELLALYDKHADGPYAQAQAQDRQAFVDLIQEMADVDLGEDALDQSEDELMARLHEKMAERRSAQTDEADANAPRRKSKPSKTQAKRQAEAELASQSLRDIYRKLASALHPDRETDPQKREARTALMQRANQAYEKKDLLALLTLQLETAQICADDIATTAPERLKLYNKALAEQLADIKRETKHIEYSFRMDFDVPPGMALHPEKLVKVLDMQVAQLRHSQMTFERDLRTFKDRQATKRWLAQEMARGEIEAIVGDWML